jgi:hypothetical protein
VTNVLRSILAVGRMPLPARRAGTIQFWTLIFLSLLLHGVGVVKAQTSSAQLSGLVIDSSGARLAGVRVVIVNSNTRVTRESITNDSGGYNFSSLLPGGYDVSASKDGFTTAKEVGITLNVGDVRSVDLTLAVGQASQTVTITASAQLVNTDNSEVAQVIDEKQVLDIPLNGRSFEQLVMLGEGAYSIGGGASSGFRPQLGNSDLGIAGGRYNSVSYLIDGMTNRDVGFGAPILFPSVEALQEFKEQTGTYSAQYGGSAQQVNINFKTGTDRLHGSVYDFVRNEALNARGFLVGARVPELRWNQFGFSAGGPVYIPKLYNGLGKTFFFANYEGLRQTANSTGYVLVPDPTQLTGVFSTTIIDPQTGNPFPNNTIPSDRISQFAKTYNKFFLSPNTNSPNGNYFGQVANPIESNQQNYRVDENINSTNSLFFRYSWSSYNGTSGGLNATGNSGQTIYNAQVRAYQGAWTKTISHSILNEFRFGYIHTINDNDAPLIDQADFNALGIQGGYSDISQYELPNVLFSGNGLSGGGTGINSPTLDRTGIWDGSDSLIINKGSHTFNIGFGYRKWTRMSGKGANLGMISFNGETSGNPLADYLLGLPQNITFPQPTPLAPSAGKLAFSFPQFSLGPYVEDQWKVTPRFSITTGLRYDFYSISRAESGGWAWLDPTVPGGGLCIGTKKLEQLGISNDLEHYCGSRTPNGAPKLDFAPRIGLAYQPAQSGRTAIRAGYGIFFDTPEENDDVNIGNIYPFFENGSYTTVPGVSQVDLATPFPVITTFAPITTDQMGFVFSAPKKRPTYSSQWSLGVEHELSLGTKISATYVGSHTVHLQTRVELGQPTYYDPNNPTPFTAREPWPNFGLSFFGQSYEPNANYIPELRWNQFGFSAGGPVYIPKLYNGLGKTFFFANYEGLRQTANSTGYVLVPDPTQLTGVFSTTIIDPQTGNPFPNNTIPSDRISQFAKTYNKFFLSPNTNSPNGNYFGQVANPIESNQQNYRVDENINSTNSLFFRYSWSSYNGTSGGLNATGNSGQTIYNAQVRAYQGAWTKTISHSILNEFRFGYIHTINDNDAPLIDQADFNALGIQGGYSDISQYELPNVLFSGNGLSGGGTGINSPTLDRTGIWDGSDSLIINKGSHTFNIGFGYRKWTRMSGKGANLGMISFNGETSGNPLADYLLGLPQNITFPQPTPLAPSAGKLAFSFPQFSLGPYVEDQWKVTPRFSITTGLRYDFYSISRAESGGWAWLDPTVPGGGLCIGTKKLEQLGISNDLEHYCGSRTPNGAPKLDFAPRIGLAYQPAQSGRTAIRAGYGIFFDTPEENDDVNIGNIYPFFENGSYTTVPGVSQVDLATPFPVITTFAPITTDQMGFVFSAPKKRPTYSSQWSLGVEHELSLGTKISATYVGSHTVHLQTRVELGQPTYYDPNNPTPFTAREPWPNFGLSFFGQSYEPNANYNAGTIKVQHNAKDLELLSSFTWSRSMDIRSGAFGVGNDGSAGGGAWAGPSDTYDLQRDYARSSFDINKRFVASFVYALPFGRGKRFLSTSSRLEDFVLGGWQVNGIGTIQSGLPYSIYGTDTDTLIGTNMQRADILHSPLPKGFHQTANEWFDTTAFAQPAPGIFGTSRRNILLDAHSNQWDLSLFKNFSIVESVKFQLRGEAFNALNRTNLGVPNTDVNSPTFGAISSAGAGRIMQVAGKIIW